MAAKNNNQRKGEKAKAPAKTGKPVPVDEVIPADAVAEKPAVETAKATTDSKNVAKAADTGADKRDNTKLKGEGAKNSFVKFVRGADPIALTCFVVILLAGLVVIGAFVNSEYIDADKGAEIKTGNTVDVNYAGSYFNYYDQSGAVIFDTSWEDVAKNSNMAKSPSFTEKAQYQTLSFKVGGNTVLADFGNAVIGHHVGDTVKVKISPDKGYGEATYESAASLDVVFNKNNTGLSLDQFNTYFGTSIQSTTYAAGVHFTLESPIGFDADCVYDSSGTFSYTYVGVAQSADVHPTPKDQNVTFTVTAEDANTFTIKYAFDTASKIWYGVSTNATTHAPSLVYYVEDPENAGQYLTKSASASNSDHNEQLGMELYFVIKIVSIKS